MRNSMNYKPLKVTTVLINRALLLVHKLLGHSIGNHVISKNKTLPMESLGLSENILLLIEGREWKNQFFSFWIKLKFYIFSFMCHHLLLSSLTFLLLAKKWCSKFSELFVSKFSTNPCFRLLSRSSCALCNDKLWFSWIMYFYNYFA